MLNEEDFFEKIQQNKENGAEDYQKIPNDEPRNSNESKENPKRIKNNSNFHSYSTESSPIIGVKKLSINDYEEITELGKGAYAKVILARNKNTKEQCAIKILNKSHINRVN
jgi:hypothetical protein